MHDLHDLGVLLLAVQRLVHEELRAQVRREDEDRRPEVDRPPLPVGEATVVQHLQQDVEDVRVGLLHLVQEDDGVRAATHRLGQLTAGLVAHVAGRRTDQAGHGVLLPVLAHVDADHRPLVVEEEVRQGLRQLRLAHTRGAQEQERSCGPVRIGHPGPGPADRIRDRAHGLGLPDEALPDLLLRVEQLLPLPLQQAAGGDAGPGGDDLGDVIRGHVVAHERTAGAHSGTGLLAGGLRGLGGGDLLLHLRDLPVQQAGGGGQVRVAPGDLRLVAQLVELLLEVAHAVEARALALPHGGEAAQLLLLVRELLLEGLQPLLRGGIGLLRQGHLLHLEAVDGALQLIDLDGCGVDLHAQAGGGLVDQVDRLVRQLPVRDVPVRQARGRHQRGVRDRDLVVRLVALLEAAQDRDGVLDAGLAHEHLLEPALQGGVLLDVLAVLVQRRRADHAQLAARQHGLEHVARVHRGVAAGARTHEGVDLVDERDDLAVRLLDLLEDRLEALLELAAVLRAGDHRGQVQADEPLVPQGLRHVAAHDALGEALDDRGLAHAGLTDEDRVVLRPAAQHLDDAADLRVAADDRVELPLARRGGEVDAVLLQRLEGGLRVLAGHLLPAAHLVEHGQQRLTGGT